MTNRGYLAVVLNYRRAQETLECLASLAASAPAPSRVIVVDNDSGDGSSGRIRAARPDVEVIDAGENLGYAGGMNAGLRRALESDLDYVLIINSDTLMEPDTASRLVRALDEHPGAGAATGTFYYHPDTQKVWYAGGDVSYVRAHAVTYRTAPAAGQEHGSAAVRNVTFLTGCAMLLRISALRRAGLFDERYFMYLEDVELSVRLRAEGHQLLYVSGAVFYHRLDADEQTPLKAYFVTRNRLLLLRTAPSFLQRLAGRAFVALALSAKSAGWLLTDRRMLRAACMGVQDCRAGRWHAGRGPGLAADGSGGRRAHADLH